jgi:fructosamine-3-kinase
LYPKLPKEVQIWLKSNGVGRIVSSEFVGGGCINNGMRIIIDTGQTFFLKMNDKAPDDMFEREAEGLETLCLEQGPRVPKVYLFERGYILLEDMKPSKPKPGFWYDFGLQLACIHLNTKTSYGFYHDNYIGSTPQINRWVENGFDFYAENRLMFQAGLALAKGLIDIWRLKRIELLAARLPQLIPDQPASLLHGDLWSGNVITDSTGSPVLIDPAVYYGWAEAELAMTALFGRFPDAFYEAYQEVRPLDAGFSSRFPIYNLYHLLNHLNLFGTSYLGQVDSILEKFL